MHCTDVVHVCAVYTQCICSVYAVYMQCECSVYTVLHAVYMQCIRSVYAVVTCSVTCSVYAVYMQCTCSVHAVYMQYICSVHAVYMQCICSVYAVLHALYMQCICSLHAVYMQCMWCNKTLQDTPTIIQHRTNATSGVQTVNKLQAACSCANQPDKAHFDKVLAAPVPKAKPMDLSKTYCLMCCKR